MCVLVFFTFCIGTFCLNSKFLTARLKVMSMSYVPANRVRYLLYAAVIRLNV